MNHMVMGCVVPFVFRVFSWFLENLEIIPLLALGYTPGTMSHLPCDIIEGNGHIMSTMSRYPRDARKGRVLCGFLRVLRSGVSYVQSLTPGRVWGSFVYIRELSSE